jgi:hypothetical protein
MLVGGWWFWRRVCVLSLFFVALVVVVWAGGVGVARASVPVFGVEGFSDQFLGPPFSEVGIESFSEPPVVALLDRGGVAFTLAGGHPFGLSSEIVFNHVVEAREVTDPGGKPEETVPSVVVAGGDPKEVEVSLPAGVVGDPLATAKRCEESSLQEEGSCPAASAVGLMVAYLASEFPHRIITPLYNMVPPAGVAAQLGANLTSLGFVIHINARVRPDSALEGGYGVSAEVTNILHSQQIYAAALALWGDPSSASHDAVRGRCGEKGLASKAEGEGVSCPVEETGTAFLRLPTSCPGRPLVSSIAARSWEEPDVLFPAEAEAGAVSGCSELEFKPGIEVQPETAAPSSATGLHVELHVPQNESVGARGEADLRDLSLELPEGMSVNPSGANGLAACTDTPEPAAASEQPETAPRLGGEIELHTSRPVLCPNSSKIGEVEVDTPLLAHPLPGSVYLAAQEANPFGSLIAIYVVIHDPVSGVLVKLAGEVQLNEATGQVTTRLSELPQFPVEEVKLDLFGGATAPLVTPSSCGPQAATAALAPWSATETVAEASDPPFEIEGCAPRAFAPSFTAGSSNAQAGAYSPFTLALSRSDQEQEFKDLEVTTPPGLLAKLAGVRLCANSEANTGSCPAESQIGTVTATAGVGPDPVSVSGTIYLTGPYNGGPFGESVEIPAIAGPFNLDENNEPVVVRGSIRINPSTGQATVLSDPFPTMLRGIPLHERSVSVTLNREPGGFTFNPTNCSALSTSATITSTTATTATISSPFEAANCASLPFAPKLTASTGRQASKLDGDNLNVTVQSAGLGQANIAKVSLTIPKILPTRLTTLQKACLAAVFEADPAACDEGSVIGTATIHTPILNSPLSGPAYLVSHGGAAFPDVEFVLQGEGVTIVLDGKTDIKDGITYSRFESTPDAPFTSFETELPAGPHSILTANNDVVPNYDLCGQNITIPTEITGQNGAVIKQNTNVALTGCPKARALTKAQLLAKALKACNKDKQKNKRLACDKAARKKYPANAPKSPNSKKTQAKKK